MKWLKYNRWMTRLLVRIVKARLLFGNADDSILYRQLDEWQLYQAPQDCFLYSAEAKGQVK